MSKKPQYSYLPLNVLRQPDKLQPDKFRQSRKAITSVPEVLETSGTINSNSDILPATMPDPQKLQEMLAALWEQHRPAIEERVKVLARASEALRCSQLTPEDREEAISAAHKLAGVLGTFGRTEGTDLARRIENWLADAETLSSRSKDIMDAVLSLKNSMNSDIT